MFLRNKSAADRPVRRLPPVRAQRPFKINPILIMFIFMGVFGISGLIFQMSNYGHETTHVDCTISTTEHVYAAPVKQWQYRVHTSCGSFTVGDDLARGQVFTFDRFHELERGQTYTFETVGREFPVLAMYPNIINATVQP